MSDLIISEDEWKKSARQVVKEMQAFTAPFVSAVSYEKPNDEPRLSGSGSFIELFGRRFLLTNEHVLHDQQSDLLLPNLAFGAHGTDEVFRMANGTLDAPYPIDCALIPVPDQIWYRPNKAQAIPEEKFNWAHVPIDREILFFRGYAQENSSFHFENLFNAGTSYGTQIMEEPPVGPDRRFFFPLHHSPEKAEMVNDQGHLPLPPGFSGSTVWDTGFVACLNNGMPWSPEQARVTGIVCRWRSGDTGIEALKIEHIRSWLLDAFHQMSSRGHL